MVGALIILICIILFKSSEGFEAVPDYCKTAGYRFSDEVQKTFTPNLDDAKRMYTPSECSKLDGAIYQDNRCVKLKDSKKKNDQYNMDNKNIDIDFAEKCKGLNKISTPPPAECSVDGVLLGIANKAFSSTHNNKTEVFSENKLRLYTKTECDKLKGYFQNGTESMLEDEKKKFIDLHGKDYGICMNPYMWTSFGCNSDVAPSATEEASNLAKKHLKNWLA